MSCGKAREIDLAAYLVDPDQPEWAAFREHYPTCPEWAEEVAAWTCIEASLRSAGDPVEAAHPAVELLKRFEELSVADEAHVEQRKPALEREAKSGQRRLPASDFVGAGDPDVHQARVPPRRPRSRDRGGPDGSS
jgi:hypothetical protein